MPAALVHARHPHPSVAGRVCAPVLLVLALIRCSAQTRVAAPPHPTPAAVPVPVEAPPAGTLLFRRFSQDESAAGFGLDSVHPDGSALRLGITRPPQNANDNNYGWSPDGSRIVFERDVGTDFDGAAKQVLMIARSGGATTPLTPGHRVTPLTVAELGLDAHPAFSPDNRTVAYEHEDGTFDGNVLAHSNIWLVDTDGSHRRQVTHLPTASGAITGIGWSPDATRLVYSFRDDMRNTALWTVGRDGSGNRRLTPLTLGAGGVPDWNKSAGLILFRAVTDEDAGVGNLFTIRPDGSGLRQVTRFTGATISHVVSFSPDGRWVTSASGREGDQSDIFLQRLDGSQFRVVMHTPADETGPSWSALP